MNQSQLCGKFGHSADNFWYRFDGDFNGPIRSSQQQ